jgi:hypothetical protein
MKKKYYIYNIYIMYKSVGVAKLSETQKSRLRNGHPVRIKIGAGNKLNLTDAQIKKLQSAARRKAAYTLTMDPHQMAQHGQGLFGDIYSKAKRIARANKDLINPIIGRVRSGVHSGIDKLSSAAKGKVDQYIKPIEGEGIKKRRGRPKKKVGEGVIGDALKGLISMTGLGVKKGRGRPPKAVSTVTVVQKAAKTKKGKGVLSMLAKAALPAIIDAAAGAAKGKVSGMGVAQKKNYGSGLKKVAKKTTKKVGGALYAAGYGPDKVGGKVGRPRKKKAGGALYAAGYSA